jgi:hypothetical protein
MSPLDPRIAGGGDARIRFELRLALARTDNPNRDKPRMVWDFDTGGIRIEARHG